MKDTVLVTGASGGIGRAIALAVAESGYGVVLHCRSWPHKAELIRQQIESGGGSARIVQFDVTDRDQCRDVLEQDIAAHGAYYGVVCNAGIIRDGAFPALSGQDWDAVIHTNLDAFYNVLHPVTMPMVRRRRPGRIVTLASVSGLMGNRGQTNYSAAKAGIIAASKSLALELAKREITVNLCCTWFHRYGNDGRTADRRNVGHDPCPARREIRRSGRARALPVVAGCGLHYPPGNSREWGHVLMKRVVVTGMAGFSPIGSTWEAIEGNLRNGITGIRTMEEWGKYTELNTRLGAPVLDFERPAHYSRKKIRSMGRVALMATRATELALEQAGLLGHDIIQDGRMGVSYGSSTGSPDAIADFGHMLLTTPPVASMRIPI